MLVFAPARDIVPAHLGLRAEHLRFEGLAVVLAELLLDVAERLPATALVEVAAADLIERAR
jgi:hypothetical protein